MSVSEQIQELSNSMGVSVNDVKNFITPIVEGMHRGGVSVSDIAGEDGLEWIAAYMESEGRKILKMQTTYLTNPLARQAMQMHIFESLK